MRLTCAGTKAILAVPDARAFINIAVSAKYMQSPEVSDTFHPVQTDTLSKLQTTAGMKVEGKIV